MCPIFGRTPAGTCEHSCPHSRPGRSRAPAATWRVIPKIPGTSSYPFYVGDRMLRSRTPPPGRYAHPLPKVG